MTSAVFCFILVVFVSFLVIFSRVCFLSLLSLFFWCGYVGLVEINENVGAIFFVFWSLNTKRDDSLIFSFYRLLLFIPLYPPLPSPPTLHLVSPLPSTIAPTHFPSPFFPFFNFTPFTYYWQSYRWNYLTLFFLFFYCFDNWLSKATKGYMTSSCYYFRPVKLLKNTDHIFLFFFSFNLFVKAAQVGVTDIFFCFRRR